MYGKYADAVYLPSKVRLESCTLCQLKCKCCYMRNDVNTVGIGYLRFADFMRFVDRHPYVKEIEISNSGEIFLNKDLPAIMEYAFHKRVALTAWSGANFNNVSDEALDALVRFRFKGLTLSIDAATQAAYEKYRVGGCLDRVFENVRKLNELKRKYNSPYPKLSWQFIIFGHNEREIPLVKKMAPELGFSNVFFKLNYDGNFSPVEDVEFVKRETGLKYVSRAEYLEHEGKSYSRSMCMALWKAPAINWDGRLHELKRKYNSPYPKLSWQFIIFGHNEREIPLVKKMAPELGFSNVFFKLNYDGNFSPVEDVEFVKRETGLKYVSRAEYLEHEGKSYSRSMCMALWKAPAINWDGRLLGCCNMYKDDFGVNVFECGLEKALDSRRFREAQKMLLNFGPETDNPCVNCQRYKIMKETKSYLTLEEIEEYKK